MKAIIIAAGMGSRLGSLTEDIPKCLLKINGKTILDHQLEIYRDNRIIDISIITGYQKDKINLPNLKYHINGDYRNNNILLSLMHAKDEMDEGFIASYSDIIFDPEVVAQLKDSRADISIVVDIDWKKYYKNRVHHPPEQAEKVLFNDSHEVQTIGKMNLTDAPGEFIGMLKCTKKGAKIFTEYFKKAAQRFSGRPFITAKVFEKAYLTDFLQFLVNEDISIKCVFIRQSWSEIDTEEDLEKARRIWGK